MELMMEFRFDGALVPMPSEDVDALSNLVPGDVVRAKLSERPIDPINWQIERKWWALAKHAYECWEPGGAEYKGVPAAKNFDRFRKDLIIWAGFRDPVFAIDGTFRFEPLSIKVIRRKKADLERLLSETINIVLRRILTNYTREGLEEVLEQLVQKTLDFDR